MPTVGLSVWIEAGQPVTGLWCEDCALPSGFEIPMLLVSDSGVGPLGMYRRCNDCDGQAITIQ